MTAAILGLGAVSFVISWVVTFVMIRLAPRVGFVDKPGHRKIHDNPKPLGGGVAIFLATFLPLLGVVAYAWFPPNLQYIESVAQQHALLGGVRKQTPLAIGIMLAMIGMHVLGLRSEERRVGNGWRVEVRQRPLM